jgi:hypothetical protein
MVVICWYFSRLAALTDKVKKGRMRCGRMDECVGISQMLHSFNKPNAGLKAAIQKKLKVAEFIGGKPTHPDSLYIQRPAV